MPLICVLKPKEKLQKLQLFSCPNIYQRLLRLIMATHISKQHSSHKLILLVHHRKENVLVINQLEINLTDENSGKLEIDFIVVNQTKKYLWNIECKTWLGDVHDKPKSFFSAINQLTKNKKNLEKWFGADLKSQWKYFTSIFCAKMELSDHKCSNGCKRFIATTEHDLCQILKNFEAENLQDSPDFSRKDFIILRYLKFLILLQMC